MGICHTKIQWYRTLMILLKRFKVQTPCNVIDSQAYQLFGETCRFHLRGKNVNNYSVSRKNQYQTQFTSIRLLRYPKRTAGLNQVAMNWSLKHSRKRLSIRRLFLDVVSITPLFWLPLLAHSHSQKSKSYHSPAYVCQVVVQLPPTKFHYHQVSNQTQGTRNKQAPNCKHF